MASGLDQFKSNAGDLRGKAIGGSRMSVVQINGRRVDLDKQPVKQPNDPARRNHR